MPVIYRRVFPFLVAVAMLHQSACAARGGTPAQSKTSIDTAPLLRCITPGINSKNLVEIKKPIRVLQQFGGDPDPGYTGRAEMTAAETKNILIDGKSAVVLLATYNALDEMSRVGNQVVVLAFFRMRAGKPVLIDAVDVGQDRFTCFYDQPVLHYKSGTDAVVIDNNHFNSSENFTALTPVALIKNRLTELVKDVPTLYNCRNSDASMTEELRLLVSEKQAGSGPRLMSMSIKVTCEHYDKNNSEKVVSTNQKTFVIPLTRRGATYFVTSKSRQLAQLQKFEKRNGFDSP